MNEDRQWTPSSLRQFESQVATLFNNGQVRAPVHLSDGNEEELISLYAAVSDDDWVFCSWRSHYHCLLKDVPEDDVIRSILAGKSIALCFPEYKVYSSAIVGGVVPIALGVALGIKRAGGTQHVWCFLGDMTAEIGVTQSAVKYAQGHSLPITFVVEDNSLSVLTETKSVWGLEQSSFSVNRPENVLYYEYRSTYPHAGAGVRVEF
jgi:TPP-dependent pyruvate/acetoin dehydrogenase alpha subunit